MNEDNYSYIRFLNAIPDDHNYDIYINGRSIAKNLSYKEFSNYFKAYPGFYRLQIFVSGDTKTPVFDNDFIIEPNKIYTAALAVDKATFYLDLIEDIPHISAPNSAYMRFINLSPSPGSIEVLVDNTPIISSLNHLQASDYLLLSPGKHSIQIRDPETKKMLAMHPGVNLKDSNYYATYFVGTTNGEGSKSEILIPLEGASYLDMGKN